jgi:hypothetical protein
MFWRGRQLVPLDGTLFDVPVSDANTAYFGGSSSGEQRADYPQARMVALGECGTHAMVGAASGPYATGERTLAHRRTTDQPSHLHHQPHAPRRKSTT